MNSSNCKHSPCTKYELFSVFFVLLSTSGLTKLQKMTKASEIQRQHQCLLKTWQHLQLGTIKDVLLTSFNRSEHFTELLLKKTLLLEDPNSILSMEKYTEVGSLRQCQEQKASCKPPVFNLSIRQTPTWQNHLFMVYSQHILYQNTFLRTATT